MADSAPAALGRDEGVVKIPSELLSSFQYMDGPEIPSAAFIYPSCDCEEGECMPETCPCLSSWGKDAGAAMMTTSQETQTKAKPSVEAAASMVSELVMECSPQCACCLRSLPPPEQSASKQQLATRSDVTQESTQAQHDSPEDTVDGPNQPALPRRPHCRLSQLGMNVTCEVKKTDCGAGWGLFASQQVPANTMIGSYCGKLIPLKRAKTILSARLRRVQQDIATRSGSLNEKGAEARPPTEMDPNYILVFREHTQRRVLTTCVDATEVGNACRFINHSCNPNLDVVPVRFSYVPVISFVSRRDIPAGEELTFSYGGTRDTSRTTTSSLQCQETTVEGVPCLCGQPQCVGVLPFEDL